MLSWISCQIQKRLEFDLKVNNIYPFLMILGRDGGEGGTWHAVARAVGRPALHSAEKRSFSFATTIECRGEMQVWSTKAGRLMEMKLPWQWFTAEEFALCLGCWRAWLGRQTRTILPCFHAKSLHRPRTCLLQRIPFRDQLRCVQCEIPTISSRENFQANAPNENASVQFTYVLSLISIFVFWRSCI